MTDGDQYIFTNRLISEKTIDRKLLEIAIIPPKSFSFKEKLNHYFQIDTLYLIKDYIKTYL